MNIAHYSFTFDIMEYDYKHIYKSFNLSYFTKDKNLLSHFVDSQELNDYEKIEKSTKDLMLIFIKKFKFRLSFRKNVNFSKEIIISDDYDFNPEILKHDELMIKIAIVKDNLDKWTNLSNYDYIFTFKENINELKEYDDVFPIKDQSVFNQIKYILNDLYRRKVSNF